MRHPLTPHADNEKTSHLGNCLSQLTLVPATSHADQETEDATQR